MKTNEDSTGSITGMLRTALRPLISRVKRNGASDELPETLWCIEANIIKERRCGGDGCEIKKARGCFEVVRKFISLVHFAGHVKVWCWLDATENP
jgi:hypothetical protein